jgi:hypothetical protein
MMKVHIVEENNRKSKTCFRSIRGFQPEDDEDEDDDQMKRLMMNQTKTMLMMMKHR